MFHLSIILLDFDHHHLSQSIKFVIRVVQKIDHVIFVLKIIFIS